MNTEAQIMIKPKELEMMRRKWNKPIRNEEFIPIENFTREVNDGNYAIVRGRKVSMITYGEKIMEEQE